MIYVFWFDSLIHLQDSQTYSHLFVKYPPFDSLIHLQDSQTVVRVDDSDKSLIHLFTYKTLKLAIL